MAGTTGTKNRNTGDKRRAGNPSLDFIQRAAEALDVSVAELLGSQPKPDEASLAQPHICNSASIGSDDSPAKNRSSSSDSLIMSLRKKAQKA